MTDPAGLVQRCVIPSREAGYVIPSHVYITAHCGPFLGMYGGQGQASGYAFGFYGVGGGMVMDDSVRHNHRKKARTKCKEVKCIDERKLCEKIRESHRKPPTYSWHGWGASKNCIEWADDLLNDPSVRDRTSDECRSCPVSPMGSGGGDPFNRFPRV